MSARRPLSSMMAALALLIGCAGAERKTPPAAGLEQTRAGVAGPGGTCASGGAIKPADAALARLEPLVGTWRGDTSGEPGAGKVERTYRFALGGRYLEAHNRSVYPPSTAKPDGEIHEDVGFYSHDTARKTLVLRQFHVEGFVSQYVLASGEAHDLVFISESIENIPSGFRARETLRFLGPDRIEETFELAPPGQELSTYSRSSLVRVERTPAPGD